MRPRLLRATSASPASGALAPAVAALVAAGAWSAGNAPRALSWFAGVDERAFPARCVRLLTGKVQVAPYAGTRAPLAGATSCLENDAPVRVLALRGGVPAEDGGIPINLAKPIEERASLWFASKLRRRRGPSHP
jgi:hypothetical protein